MLTIRLSRIGKKGQPSYRFIVSEKGRDPWGKALEILGSYNPLVNPAQITLEKERILYWIGKGAQTSDTVNNLLINEGVIQGEKRKLMQISKKRAAKIAKKKQA